MSWNRAAIILVALVASPGLAQAQEGLTLIAPPPGSKPKPGQAVRVVWRVDPPLRGANFRVEAREAGGDWTRLTGEALPERVIEGRVYGSFDWTPKRRWGRVEFRVVAEIIGRYKPGQDRDLPRLLGGGQAAKPAAGRGDPAVSRALAWLAAHQSANGRWEPADWKDNCKGHRCAGPGRDLGDARYDVGVTGLVLQVFLTAGHGPDSKTYGKTVTRGLAWLESRLGANGSIGFERGEEIYNHAIATRTLLEATDLDPELKNTATIALDFCLRAQNPNRGWKYGIKPGNNDTSVTGWMILALESARLRGITVPDEAFQGAGKWLAYATAANGATGYSRAGGGSSYIPAQKGQFDELPTMTAVSIAGRLLCGSKPEDRDIQASDRLLDQEKPLWPAGRTSKVNFYYWYYGSLAKTALGQGDGAWVREAAALLRKNQRRDGREAGSWDGVGEWSIAGGRITATALAAKTLLIPRRRALDQQKKR